MLKGPGKNAGNHIKTTNLPPMAIKSTWTCCYPPLHRKISLKLLQDDREKWLLFHSPAREKWWATREKFTTRVGVLSRLMSPFSWFAIVYLYYKYVHSFTGCVILISIVFQTLFVKIKMFLLSNDLFYTSLCSGGRGMLRGGEKKWTLLNDGDKRKESAFCFLFALLALFSQS